MPVRSEWVEVSGDRAHYRSVGDGPTIILVHGLGLSSRIYTRNCEALARAGFRVVAPDLPGFGVTPGPQRGLGVAESARWLAWFARALNITHAAWIAHSISCQSVIALAAAEPHLARALVLIAPTGAPGRARRMRQLLQFMRNAPREPFWAVREVARDYLGTSPSKYIGTWLKSFEDRPLARLSAIRCPTLIVIGTRDSVIPRSYIATLNSRIPDSAVAEIAGGAHGVPFDRRGAVDRRVGDWLRCVYAGGSVGTKGGCG